jgi:hypothetical protein
MTGSLRQAVGSRLPWGLLGMLASVLVVECSFARNDINFLGPETASWRLGPQSARRRAPAAEILCFGDSLVKLGVVPKVLERRLKRRVYNLALIAGQPPATFFLLRKALEAGAKPSALIVDYEPHLLSLPPQKKAPLWSELAGVRDCFELAWTAREASFFGAVMLARCLPSARFRWEIRNTLRDSLRGTTAAVGPEIAAHWRNWNWNQGAMILPKNLANTGRVDPPNWILYPDRWWSDPINTVYVRRFLDLAAERHIPVFWVIPPMVPQVQATREQKGLDALYTRYARAVQARYSNLVVVDARHAGYPHRLFVDAAHLDRDGARRFSAELADVLGRRLQDRGGQSRWFELPASHDVPEDPPIEDLQQSRLALQASSMGRS